MTMTDVYMRLSVSICSFNVAFSCRETWPTCRVCYCSWVCQL